MLPKEQTEMTKTNRTAIGGTFLAVIFSVWLAGPALASAALPQRPTVSIEATAAQTTTPAPQTSANSEMTASYAARERSARDLETFKGGDFSLYIGGSALAAALLI